MRYKMIIAYDGSYFHGFQRQKEEISVQETIENALSTILKQPIIIHGAGRTDAFVHAYGQVAHFDSTQYVPADNLKKILNKYVYPHIYVKDISFVNDNFHAQKSAVGKEYHYKVSINKFDPLLANYVLFFHDRIDISKIREAMKYIVGTHDFKTFAKLNINKNTVRTIYKFDLTVKEGILEFKIIGNGFMYNMVRIIISLMLKVGEGKFPPEHIKEILEQKNRKYAPFVAAPQGLYLCQVFYDKDYLIKEEEIIK